MCGIFGYFDKKGNLSQAQSSRLAKGMARVAQGRGEDASGYAIYNKSEIEVTKKAVPARSLIFDTKGCPIFIGHTRYATMGDPNSDAQAHPFLSKNGNYALTHNGVGAYDFEKLSKLLGLDAEIDSQGMLQYLELVGFDESGISKFYSDWQDSGFAIAVLNSSNQSLTLFRNEFNPLYMAYTSEGVLVYGSTKEIILTGCLTSGLTIIKMASLIPGIRYEFSLLAEPNLYKIPTYSKLILKTGS